MRRTAFAFLFLLSLGSASALGQVVARQGDASAFAFQGFKS
jgi:hypothetical protein